MFMNDPNVRKLMKRPGSIVTYDELGNPVVTNATIKNGDGSAALSYDPLRGTSPYGGGMKGFINETFSRWRKGGENWKNDNTASQVIRFAKDRLRALGYDVDEMTPEDILNHYRVRTQNGAFDIGVASGRVTGVASTAKR